MPLREASHREEVERGEFKVGRSGVRRSSALGPDRLGHARAFRLAREPITVASAPTTLGRARPCCKAAL
eukprot:scaffold8100_cov117-Isochrysis_galbana.AAC.10